MTSPVVTFDCEWGFQEGRRDRESSWEPVVACARVGGETFTFWGRDNRLADFARDYRDRLWVAHSATAEQKFLLRLAIELPARWFDTLVAFRLLTNQPARVSASLVSALHATGLGHLVPADKHELREKIVDLDFTDADLPAIEQYCHADVRATESLFEKLVGQVDPIAMQFWGTYLAAVARMELRGIPLDTATLKLILNNREHLRRESREEVNKTATIYRPNGSFSGKAFFKWVRSQSIRWPQKLSDRGREYRPLDDDTFGSVERRHPFIAQVREKRKTLRSLNKFTPVVDGRTRRHYFSALPFSSLTGRNQPRRFLFSGSRWQRFLIIPPTSDHVLVYSDFSAQEVGIAAALSGDEAMRGMYAADDPHLEFAIRAGAVPVGATGDSRELIRTIYKTVSLGVLYGQTAEGIAGRLGIEVEEAQTILDHHKQLFNRFHRWSERVVSAAYERGHISTRCGWRANVRHDTKWRTLANFPIQATGADILRALVVGLDQQGVQLLAPVHDAVLMICRREQLPQLHEAVEHARRAACDAVLDGFQLKMKTAVFADRFEDKKGADAWRFILSKLPKEKLYVPPE